ncbi:MAG: GNAT family N-acetyltransferase [Clostridia bacterium]|nr:GNAT family N-acetyltransferase [Clostridia bacterium]
MEQKGTDKLKFKQVDKLSWVSLGKEQEKSVVSEEKVNASVFLDPKKYLLYDVYKAEERIANIILRFNKDGSVFLLDFGILEEKLGQGYGIMMISQLSELLSKNGVTRLIATSNKGALNFYKKVGFDIVKEERFEQDGKRYREFDLEKTL